MVIFDVVKTAAKVAQEAGKIELYGEILQVYEKLLDQQKCIADLESENKELRQRLELEESLLFERNAYWRLENDQKDGPFCSRCKDTENKLVRMRVDKYTFGWAFCPGCNKCTPEPKI